MAIASLRPAILIIALAFLFQETFLPSLSQSNEENRLVKQDRINSEDGYWFASNSSINFFKTSPSKDSINDVTTYQYGKEGNINQITDSKYAKRQNGIWTLFDLTVTDFQKNSILFQEEKIWPEGPKDSDMRRILSPRYLSIGELNEALKLNISEYRRNNLSLEYWKKIFHPITTILLILLAASFVFGRVRDDSIGKRILAGVLFAFSLNICQNLFASMAAVSLLSPFYAVTLPIAGVIVLTTIFWKLKSN
jgi:lipopolysaccharide export system permease protein